MSGSAATSLGEALRGRAWRIARAEAYRFHVAMGLAGFVGGLVVVVPVVQWLASMQLARRSSVPTPAGLATAIGADLTRKPALVSAPTLADRELQPFPAPIRAARATTAGHAESLAAARTLIRNGRIAVARELLARDDLVETGEASFILAETYDPNVLAALGVTSVPADAGTARRLYDAALSKGIAAAAQRLDALE